MSGIGHRNRAAGAHTGAQHVLMSEYASGSGGVGPLRFGPARPRRDPAVAANDARSASGDAGTTRHTASRVKTGPSGRTRARGRPRGPSRARPNGGARGRARGRDDPRAACVPRAALRHSTPGDAVAFRRPKGVDRVVKAFYFWMHRTIPTPPVHLISGRRTLSVDGDSMTFIVRQISESGGHARRTCTGRTCPAPLQDSIACLLRAGQGT